MIAAHDEVCSASEPWFLLPFLYTLRDKGAYGEFGYGLMREAIEDFCHNLPNGKDDYLEEIHTLALRLYKKAANPKARYFLDKTPRYHLVVNDIIRMFPDGKFLFLWRNPLAVVASIMETWGKGKWNLYAYKVDLFEGLENLVNAFEQHGDRILAMQYEDLISSPEASLRKIFDYLDLEFDKGLLTRFRDARFDGRMGDPTGVRQYRNISQEPLDKWKGTLNNPLRKSWCRRYLKWIGEHRLMLMGYDMDTLQKELEEIPFGANNMASDALRMAYGVAYCILDLPILGEKLAGPADWHRVHANY
jgi:hypothetical protein